MIVEKFPVFNFADGVLQGGRIVAVHPNFKAIVELAGSSPFKSQIQPH